MALSRVILLLFVLYFVCKADDVIISVKPATHPTTNHSKSNAPYTLRLGVVSISDLVGPITEGIFVAADYLNNNASILPNVAIEIYTSPYSLVDTDNLFNALYHIKNLNVAGFLASVTSQQSKVVQQIAKLYNVPQISPYAITGTLSDKSQYPTFMRTIPSDATQIEALISFFKECGWKKGVIIYTPDEYGNGNSQLIAEAGKANISLIGFPGPATASSKNDYATVVNTVKGQVEQNGYRIFIIYVTSPPLAQYCMQAMNDTGLIGAEFVTILTATTSDAFQANTNVMYNSPLLEGVFGIGAGYPIGPEFDSFLTYWKTLNITQWTGVYVSPFYAIDAVLSFAYAVDSLMSEGVAFQNATGKLLLNRMLNQSFSGTTGQVNLDAQGNRIGYFEMYNFAYNKPTTHVGRYDTSTNTYTKLAPYVFYGGASEVPRDSPFECQKCVHGDCVEDVGCVCDDGWTGSSCDVKESSPTAMLPWLIPLIVVIVAAFVGVYFFYKKKRSALVREVAEKQRSQIARGDLVLHDRIGRGASGEVCKAQFRGTEVAVKKIITSHVSKNTIEEFELEVAIMCGLRHPNIILFMGSCYNASSQEMLLVMEFMSRGSLNDVLNNPKVPLPYEMKLSLACQAAQGMNFLHQSTPPLVHRDLKSHNILIDDKWNARISDFGITKFKEDTRSARNSNSNKENSIGTIYWSAPEVLQGDLNTNEKCDCYSFGIVLWEIFHRKNPYVGRDPMSVAIDVIRSDLRPTIHADVPAEIKDLMQACWAPKPEDRPSFQEIMTTLRKLLSTRSLTTPSEPSPTTRVDAPTGHVYLVTTGVQGAYALWEAIPRAMEESMKLHNQIIRKNLEMYNGYEGSSSDHSFVCAFSNVDDAVNFSITLQMALLHASWPAELLAQHSGRTVYENGALQWAGLRVKVGITSGVPNCEIDNSSGRMNYFGPVVEKTMHLLGLSKGFILASDPVAAEITKKNPRFIHEISLHKIGDMKSNSARNKPEDVHEISIKSLHRKSSAASNEPAMPHTVVDMIDYDDEATTPPTPKKPTPGGPLTVGSVSDVHSVTWVTKKSEIGIKESIGKGAIGDYFRGNWRGKEVAFKVLVNQKLKEDDLLRLIGDSAYMSKLNHPNILPFHAVCLEPNYITVVSEFESKGNLKNILADSSIQLSWPRKLKIALELAHGLSYLTSLPDTTLQMHDNMKSNNVLIGKDWEVKVADYGHSNIRELARTMTSVGNIAWTAPEILNGEPATPKIALYSYGIILWELYTRQIPYVNEHPIRVVNKILNGYRPPIPSDCPAAYQEIIRACLVNEPDNRPSWAHIISSLSSLSAE